MEEPDDLPGSYREKSAHEPLPRVICDYIAGMTDPFIYQQYEKYCGNEPSPKLNYLCTRRCFFARPKTTHPSTPIKKNQKKNLQRRGELTIYEAR